MLTIVDVGKLLGLKRAAIYTIPASELPYYLVGKARGARRYRRDDVDAYLQRCRVDRDPNDADPEADAAAARHFRMTGEPA